MACLRSWETLRNRDYDLAKRSDGQHSVAQQKQSVRTSTSSNSDASSRTVTKHTFVTAEPRAIKETFKSKFYIYLFSLQIGK